MKIDNNTAQKVFNIELCAIEELIKLKLKTISTESMELISNKLVEPSENYLNNTKFCLVQLLQNETGFIVKYEDEYFVVIRFDNDIILKNVSDIEDVKMNVNKIAKIYNKRDSAQQDLESGKIKKLIDGTQSNVEF